jgi:thiamine biosynthesis lipoprotein
MPLRRVLIPKLTTGLPVPNQHARFELHWEGRSMGTSWRVTAFGDGLAASRCHEIGAGINARLDSVVRQMSHFDPDSDLSRLNRAAAGSIVQLPQELFRVLRCGIEIANATCGWFDPTLGAASALWGFGPEPVAAFPAEATIMAVIERCGWQKLQLDSGRCAAYQPGGLQLNLGGIAKGFAVDYVLEWLRHCGLDSALVEIGGELAAFGVKPDGTPWWVALENPPSAVSLLPETVVALADCAVASSGDWMQRRWVGARLVTHLIDPTTGTPYEGCVAGATVIHESCMIADAWATALCVAPPSLGMRLAEWYGLAARIVFRNSSAEIHEWLTPAMRTMAS